MKALLCHCSVQLRPQNRIFLFSVDVARSMIVLERSKRAERLLEQSKVRLLHFNFWHYSAQVLMTLKVNDWIDFKNNVPLQTQCHRTETHLRFRVA